jgi:hypothetical protein
MADYPMTVERLTRGLKLMGFAVMRVEPLQRVNTFAVWLKSDPWEDKLTELEQYQFEYRRLGIYSGDRPVTLEEAAGVIHGEYIDGHAFVYVMTYTPANEVVAPPPGQFIKYTPDGMVLSDNNMGWTMITGGTATFDISRMGKKRRGPFDME